MLLLLLFVVWCLWVVASTGHNALEAAAAGRPRDRVGASIMPAIPVFFLGFWGVALVIDHVAAPWGTRVVGGFHVVCGVVLLVDILWVTRRLRSIDGRG